MAKMLLIESRDPFGSRDVEHDQEMATALARAGEDVTVLLVQNGVLPARRTARSDGLARLREGGVTVLADDFSLRERGIRESELADGLRPVPIDTVVERMLAGDKVLWL